VELSGFYADVAYLPDDLYLKVKEESYPPRSTFWWMYLHLEAVMNSIRNGLGMRETEIAKEPSRPWNPHSYAVFAQVHNTL
jgi:hypothetical protein